MVERVQSVERAMTVLTTFGATTPRLSLAEVAEIADLPRGTVHRLLATLEDLGYIRNDRGIYELTPKVLEIGHGYLSSQSLPELARRYLDELSETVDEHCSLAVLEGTEVLCIAATPGRHALGIATRVGTRMPAAVTSLGRALLADLDDHEVVTRLGIGGDDRRALLDELAATRLRGYSLADQAQEPGLVATGAPVRDSTGTVVAAMAIATHVSRYSIDAVERHLSPKVVDAANRLSEALVHRG